MNILILKIQSHIYKRIFRHGDIEINQLTFSLGPAK